MGRGLWSERWAHLKIRAELALGKSKEARASYEEALKRFPTSVTLRLLGREVDRAGGRPEAAAAELDAIERMIVAAPYRYASPEGRLALGRFFLAPRGRRQEGARPVLRRRHQEAARLRRGLPGHGRAGPRQAGRRPGRRDARQGARGRRRGPAVSTISWPAPSPRTTAPRSTEALDEALKINPRHVDSLLLQADHLIDAEQYDEAARTLDRAWRSTRTSPAPGPTGRCSPTSGTTPRRGGRGATTALAPWATNPEVDHLIGRKLSQKYRFAEGAEAQQRALALDPDYLPAKVQLCQDLLRLGEEDGGLEARRRGLRRGRLQRRRLQPDHAPRPARRLPHARGDGLVVRMDPREADLYGDRVLDLLKRARRTLGEKYGVDARRAGDRRDLPAARRSSPCGPSASPGPTGSSASASAG